MTTLTENSTNTIDPAFKALAGDLKRWLDKDENDFVLFRRWLTGYEIHILSRERQNYGWILEGLKVIDDEFYYQKLAEKTASFLTEVSPEKYLVTEERYDDEFLYNLYYLCVGLKQKDILAKPLQTQYKYFNEHPEQREIIFRREGIFDVSDAFREALISNQIDDTYYEVWENIMKRKEDAFLFTYSILDGYRGINSMPSNDNASAPNTQAIGKALKLMANYFTDLPESERNIRGLLERTQEVWSDYQHFEQELYKEAIENSFPSWATDEILLPLIQVNSKTAEVIRYDVWAFIPNALTKFGEKFKTISQGDFVLTIEIPITDTNTIYFINGILEKVVIVRNQTSQESFPFQMKGIANELLSFKNLLDAKRSYNYGEVVFDVYKKLRKFHQRKEFQSKIEELYS